MSKLLGRNAEIYKDDTLIGYAKGVTAGIDADLIKDYDLGDDKPTLLESGNKSFPITIDKAFIDKTYAEDVLNGTKVELKIYPAGSTSGKPVITLSNCIMTSWEFTFEQDGVVLESISGEGASITFGTVA